jgi:small-conductance mechanosensitive channel
VIAELARSRWLVGLAVFGAWLVVLFVAKWLIFASMKHASVSRRKWVDGALSALSLPLNVVIVVAGIAVAASFVPVTLRGQAVVSVLVTGAVVLALIIFTNWILWVWMGRAAARFPMLGESYGLVTGALRGLVIGLGLMMFLESVGISVNPILASLGIGSLALALALQETVKNVFSGFFLIVDMLVDVGDFVMLQSGQQGCLMKLGWRSAKFRMLNDSVVIVPNSLLVDSILVSYRAGGIPNRGLATGG